MIRFVSNFNKSLTLYHFILDGLEGPQGSWTISLEIHILAGELLTIFRDNNQ